MTDRLRELDSLFAERVLGWKDIQEDPDGWFGYDPDGINYDLPRYTRSLDAAWEGVRPALHTKYWLTGPPHMSLWFEGTLLNEGETKVTFGSPCGRFSVEAKADHPAEALVLACLRAVGVSEEELE